MPTWHQNTKQKPSNYWITDRYNQITKPRLIIEKPEPSPAWLGFYRRAQEGVQMMLIRNPDYAHWITIDCYTPEELSLLLIGLDPRSELVEMLMQPDALSILEAHDEREKLLSGSKR